MGSASPKCARGRHGNHRRGPKVARIQVACEVCGKVREYLPSQMHVRKRIRFCSQRCHGLANDVTIPTTCAFCGASFQRQRHRRSQRFCSVRCKGLARRKPDAVWPGTGPSRNPVAQRAYHARYQREHRQRINELSQKWRRENHAKRLEVQKRYRDSHKQKICDISRNRRGAKQSSTAASVDFEAIARRDRMICHLCRKPVTRETLHF